jgi:Spy/CpxP family protein refolding chaperone
MKTLIATVLLAALTCIPAHANTSQSAFSQPPQADSCPPPAVVAAFLQLTEAQTAQFGPLLAQFETTVHSLQQQIAARQAQVDILAGQPNPNPVPIGVLVLQIHALEQQISKVANDYHTQFAAILTDEQKQKVAAVTQASQLQPVVGAFVALYLVPPPTPLPCEKQ